MATEDYSWQVDWRRLHQWQTYRALTSPAMVLSVLIVWGLMVVVWALQIIGVGHVPIGVLWLVTSAAFGWLLVYVFASTYYPWLPARVMSLEFVGLADTTFNHPEAMGLPKMVTALLHSATGRKFLDRLQLNPTEVTNTLLSLVVPTMLWPELVQQAQATAQQCNSAVVEVEHVLASFLLHPTAQAYLRSHELQTKDIIFVAWWLSEQRRERRHQQRWWDAEQLLAFTGIGLSWTSGFTPLVDQFSHFPPGNIWDRVLVGRQPQIDQLITTLARGSEANVLLVGQAGVGRLGIVREMARRVQTHQAHPALNGQRVVYMHIGEILARGQSGAGQLAIVSQVLREMERAGNIVAVIDGLGSILAQSGEERLNLTDVLLPFFGALTIRVVVITSSDEYYLRLKNNEELMHFFEVIHVESVNTDTTLQILSVAAPSFEKKTGVNLPYTTLRAIVEGTESILPHIPFPERAFDVLEEALVTAQANHTDTLSPEDIATVLTRKVGIPMGQLKADERVQLLSLEDTMHQRIVNQRRAVATVARAMIRARAGIRTKERPIGTFLFLGPTGVGKTETAKTLAAVYFGSENYLARLDMSEYQSEQGVATLIGNAEQPVGRLTALISDHPFTVLLLDEFEKAHLSVQQLFLQILDEGHLTDVRGQVISFKHTLIIATSNAGAEFIRERITDGQVPADFDNQLRDYILQQGIFRPELLNRFDGVVTFTPLSMDDLREVATLMLKKLNKRLESAQGVTVAITPQLVDFLLEIGYTPEFGARPMNRAIQDTVEYAVAQRVLQNALQPGEVIQLDPAALRALKV